MLIKKLLPILAIAFLILSSCTKEDIKIDLFNGLNKKTTSVIRKTSTTINANTNTGLNCKTESKNSYGTTTTYFDE